MEYKDCAEFAAKCGTVFIATTEGNIPHVRPLALSYHHNPPSHARDPGIKGRGLHEQHPHSKAVHKAASTFTTVHALLLFHFRFAGAQLHDILRLCHLARPHGKQATREAEA